MDLFDCKQVNKRINQDGIEVRTYRHWFMSGDVLDIDRWIEYDADGSITLCNSGFYIAGKGAAHEDNA